MKREALACLLLISGTTAWAQDEPLDPPTVKLDLHIEQEAYGQCANIVAGMQGRPPLVRWNSICHGWRTFSCGDHVLLVEIGIKTDRAIVIFERNNRTGDPMTLISREIARKWPGNEILDLAFGTAGCREGSFVLPFKGSFVPSKGGSGHGMKGLATFHTPEKSTISIQPTK